MEYICPVCGEALTPGGQVWRCVRGHSFDVARQGYVNLLTSSQKHAHDPGDTREQVAARRAFLGGGYYAPIVEALAQAARQFQASGPLLDVGCGEGYYSARLAQAMGAELTGVDISREAVRCAAGQYKQARWLCATAAHLPVADGQAGTLTSLFAVTIPGEFRRVLRQDGIFFQILAGPDHLLGLKSIIYPRLLEKPKASTPELPGFRRVDSIPIRFPISLQGADVRNLLYMTPHVYRIGPEGANRLRQTRLLEDRVSCVLNCYAPA